MEINLKWHALSAVDALKNLKTDSIQGLAAPEYKKRIDIFGPNVFSRQEKFRILKLFWEQVRSPLVFILVFAGVITFLLDETADTIVIFASVTINTVVGMYQEGRASKAFEKLRTSPRATPLRLMPIVSLIMLSIVTI